MNLFRGLLIAFGWLLFGYLCWAIVTTPRPATALQTMEDFNAYYLASQAWRAGESVYRPDVTTAIQYAYLYPPLLAQLIVPLTFFDFPTASRIWLVLSLLVFYATLYGLARQVPSRRARDLILLAPLLFMPAYLAFDTGQVATSLMAILAGVWIAHKSGRGFLAGCLLALACWIKVYPAFVAVIFLWQRDWAVIKGVAVAGIALGLLQLLLAPQDLLFYVTSVLPELNAEGQPMLNQGGASTLGFAELVAPTIAQPLRWLLSLASVVATLVITRRTNRRLLGLDYGLALITAAVIGATYLLSGWVNLFLLAAILLAYDRRTRAWAVIAMVYAVLTTVPLLTLGILPRHSSGWLAYLPFLAFILMWGYLAWLRVRRGEIKTGAAVV